MTVIKKLSILIFCLTLFSCSGTQSASTEREDLSKGTHPPILQDNLLDKLSKEVKSNFRKLGCGEKGRFVIMVTVTKEGTLENPETTKKMSGSCTEALRRSLSHVEVVRPAYANGRPVDTNLSIPITVQI